MTLLMLLIACRGPQIADTAPGDSALPDTAASWAESPSSGAGPMSESDPAAALDTCSCRRDLWRHSGCEGQTQLLAVCLVDADCTTSSFGDRPWDYSPSLKASSAMAVRWEFDGPVRQAQLNGPPLTAGNPITRAIALYAMPVLNPVQHDSFSDHWMRDATLRLTENDTVITLAFAEPPAAGEWVRSTIHWSPLLSSGSCDNRGYSAAWEVK